MKLLERGLFVLEDIVQRKKNEYTRENAKSELDKGNYPLTKTILEVLWDNSNKDDEYLLYDYGKALRKTKKSIKFVEIYRELNDNKKIISNKWIVSMLCWCLYDSYIKNYSVSNKNGFNNFINNAEHIINNCEQMNADEHYKNPYVLTIKKVVKIYTEKSSSNFNKIIEWLSYLAPDRLSEEVFNFQDETGKDRELASIKEFYYQHMAKALEKTEKYEDCITICETAFKQISKFHYRNDTWLKARMYYSKCMVNEDIESAIREYKELADRENYWFMYHKLSQICFRYNKVSDALLYASKAYSGRFEYEKMVNLLLDTALLWQARGNNENANFFFQASAYYRERQGWMIPEELKYAINLFDIDVKVKPNIILIKSISKDYITIIEGKSNRLEGKIFNIFSHGGSGFIEPSKGGTNVYFNMKDVGGKALIKGDRVEYEMSKGKDGKPRAVKVTMRG